MADRTRIAVLSVTHLSKGGAGGSNKALYRFIGSIAFTAAPRAAFMVMQDPEDKSRCLFLHGKNNLAATPQGLAYRLEQRLIARNPDMIGSAVAWESESVQITAEQAMAAGNSHEPSAKDNAIEFLSDLLTSGAMKVSEIETEARAAGLLGERQPIGRDKPFRLAREDLGIKPYQAKGQKAGGWFWALPDQVPSEMSDAF